MAASPSPALDAGGDVPMSSSPPPSISSSSLHQTPESFRPKSSHSMHSAPPTGSSSSIIDSPGRVPTAASSKSGSAAAAARRFQLEVSECVETKTVTTTTRRTRKFPSVYVRDPLPLSSLDAREYPLAMQETPADLTDFSCTFIEEEVDVDETVEHLNDPEPEPSSVKLGKQKMINPFAQPSAYPPLSLPSAYKREIPDSNERSLIRESRQSSASPSETQSRRPRSIRSTRVGPFGASSSSSKIRLESSRPDSSSRPPLRTAAWQGVSERLRQSLFGGGAGPSTTTTTRPSAAGVLATPETAESSRNNAESNTRLHPRFPDSIPDSLETTPTAQRTLPVFDAAESPADSDSQTIFSSNVATPPITDADAQPLDDSDLESASDSSVQAEGGVRDVIHVATSACLPSPRLSPTLMASAQLQSEDQSDTDAEGGQDTTTTTQDEDQSNLHPKQEEMDITTENFSRALAQRSSVWAADAEAVEHIEGNELVPAGYYHGENTQDLLKNRPVVIDTQTLLEAFDSMRTEMKTFMMYQFLRRCPRPTLRIIANTVNPTLKCDFLKRLPLELGYTILSYLDYKGLCRAAQVSRHWRSIVDRNETGWKELLDRDGLKLPPGELHKAITQGWGWQDPEGVNGCEKDLSMQSRLTSSEQELLRSVKQETPKRSSKRKRGMTVFNATERNKRRALAHKQATAAAVAAAAAAAREEREANEATIHKSEGPITAASVAAAAVPDPQIGLSSLRQLHLFKSLYRRHHMIRESWTNGKVQPSHVAFAAHPRHVITCLQFDDDKIITGSDDTLIHVYDTKTGKLRKRLEGHEGGVWALEYVGNNLVSGSTDRSVRVWDIERGLCQQVFYGHTSTVRCLQILMPTEMGRNPDGTRIMQPEKPLIITGSRDSQLRVWRLPEPGSRRYIQTGPPAQETDCPYFIRVLSGHTHSVRAIATHGDTLVSGSYDSTVRVWRISTGESLHVLSGHAQKVYSVVLDTKRNRCISGSMDSLVKIWDLDTGACLYTLEGHTMLVGLLDLQEDRLVSAAADSTLRIWDPANGRCKHMLMAHTGAITCFEHDGRKVVSGSEKTVKMWDVRNGDCLQDLLTDLRGVWQVKFDHRRCVAAVQRDDLTYIEILDFGAVRDGYAPEQLGKRVLLNEWESRTMEED